MTRLYDTYEVPSDQAAEFSAILGQGNFPHHKMLPGVLRDVGRDHIPMRFSDLSRFAGGGHSHEPGAPHVLGTRNQVWGLFWLDYRVEIEQSLSFARRAKTGWYELGHAADYSMLTDPDRTAIAAAMHPEGPDAHPAWWEEKDYHGEYFTLPGETFMGVFYTLATGQAADLVGFAHQVTSEVVAVTRRILIPESVEPAPQPEPEPAPPAPTPPALASYFGLINSNKFHDLHRFNREDGGREVEYATYQAAIDAGRKPCGVCKPQPEVAA